MSEKAGLQQAHHDWAAENWSPEELQSLTSCYISEPSLVRGHFPPMLRTRGMDTNEERGELIFQYRLPSLAKARQKGNTGMNTGDMQSGLERPWDVESHWKGKEPIWKNHLRQ